MASESERTKILEMIELGTITAEEGMTLLNALSESIQSDDEGDFLIDSDALPEPKRIVEEIAIEGTLPDPFDSPGALEIETEMSAAEPFDGQVEVIEPNPMPPNTEDIEKWKRWWVIPFWVGTGIVMIGGLLMYAAFSKSGFGFWFACAWFPFLLGVALLIFAWGSRTVPWLHVRVQQAPGETPQRIAISFPIPVRLATWGFRLFGRFIPNIEGVDLEEIFKSLKDVAKDGTPFFVDVDEGENGEKVQVFIG